jgi:phospholipid/cholesterol/gamma-HCH transport system substrate-binding protein
LAGQGNENDDNTVIRRVAAVGAVAFVAVAVIAFLIARSGPTYTVKADFQDASQIVKGNLVQVSGRPVGKVTSLALTSDGRAQLTLQIDAGYAPLREGTEATVRASSLSGVANRYIDLRMAPARARPIPNGGAITGEHTTSAVDLDQIFNIFGPRERKALSAILRGSANQYTGRGAQGNAGLTYLNPAIASTTALFGELNRDTGLFRRFVSANSRLVTDVSQRANELAGLVDNLATTTGAIGRQQGALQDAIVRLPPFMRRANTTFVNLRATLDDLTPLVDESKPVARRLRPFLLELRPLAEQAQPTVRDLANLIRSRGPANDLVDLTAGNAAVRNVAIGPVRANGATREGAFAASTSALEGATPELASARPYAPDLLGWFDDFSTSGPYDALGGVSRAPLHVNLFSLVNNVPNISPSGLIPPGQRAADLLKVVRLHQNNRCPGSVERPVPGESSNDPSVFAALTGCDPSQTPLGP